MNRLTYYSSVWSKKYVYKKSCLKVAKEGTTTELFTVRFKVAKEGTTTELFRARFKRMLKYFPEIKLLRLTTW